MMPQPFLGTAQLRLDLLHLKTTNILQFNTLEQVPDAFLRIEFWRISWQALEMDAFGSPFCQKDFDGLTAMNARSVPDHQQFAGDLAQEELQEVDHIRPFV